MENEKFNIVLSNGVEKAEIILREVSVVNELPVAEPIRVNISGTIGAPLEFLKKRKDCFEQVNQKRCHLFVNREKIAIGLITNEDDFYHKGSVTGVLEFHPKFKEFGINTGKTWTPSQLGLFFKMNRAFFPNPEINMKLVHDLMNFTATVNNSIDRSMKETGDRTDKFEQVVNSNLPKSFHLSIPLFKGSEKTSIEVETFAQINGKEVSFTLLSPGAQACMEDIRDKAIDEQIQQISSICPDIAIIEV
jgi:hypothetical protein